MKKESQQGNDSSSSKSGKIYSLGEEIANSITHGIGACLSIAGLTLLVVLASIYGDAWRVVSFSIYGATLFSLYLASTLYHSFRNPRAKRVLKVIDHALIYFLIAGTYTPFLLVTIKGTLGWVLLFVIWGLAITGAGIKAVYVNRFRKLSLAAYIIMGWLSVIAMKEIVAAISLGGLVWLAAGGLFYTTGIIFYTMHRMPYNHAVWHLFVLAGSICHFFSILFYVLPVS